MEDALEILNDLQDIINREEGWANLSYLTEELNNYLQQKRTEFEPSRGDCCA
jgi:hypothetical protein